MGRSKQMEQVKLGWNLVRWVLAAVSVYAVFVQANYLIAKGGFQLGPFLSFFTIQANLFTVIVLVIEAAGGFGISETWRTGLRGAAVLYLGITGLVYAVLLSQLPMVKEIVHPFADGVHHLLMPLWILFDWVAFAPSNRPTYRQSLSWLVYPLAYLFFSLVRGGITGWYPYPFLNPNQPGRWLAVSIVSVVILLIACAMIWAILRLVPRNQLKQ
ncbi:MAG: Pr6Pr family membrane protein [Pirellula sp.]